MDRFVEKDNYKNRRIWAYFCGFAIYSHFQMVTKCNQTWGSYFKVPKGALESIWRSICRNNGTYKVVEKIGNFLWNVKIKKKEKKLRKCMNLLSVKRRSIHSFSHSFCPISSGFAKHRWAFFGNFLLKIAFFWVESIFFIDNITYWVHVPMGSSVLQLNNFLFSFIFFPLPMI